MALPMVGMVTKGVLGSGRRKGRGGEGGGNICQLVCVAAGR